MFHMVLVFSKKQKSMLYYELALVFACFAFKIMAHERSMTVFRRRLSHKMVMGLNY